MIPLGFPYFRLFNIGWFPSLKIKKLVGSTLLENERVGGIYQISISCVSVDMKFTSKLLWILLMQSLSFLDPHFLLSRFQSFIVSKFHNFKISKIQHSESWVHTCSDIFEILDSHISKDIIFQDVPIYFLIFAQVFLVW